MAILVVIGAIAAGTVGWAILNLYHQQAAANTTTCQIAQRLYATQVVLALHLGASIPAPPPPCPDGH